MKNQHDEGNDKDFISEAQGFLARHGLTAEALLEAVCTDESGRGFNPAVTFGGLVEGLNSQNERERAPRVLGHLQRAMTPQPSGRWQLLVSRRAAQIRAEAVSRLAEKYSELCGDPRQRPAAWLRACLEAAESEVRILEQERDEARTQIRRAEQALEPLQARLTSFLRANASRQGITRLVELLTALLQIVDRGVGVTAVVLMAERLVNDREAHALRADAATAAIGILQEVLGQIQTLRDQVGRFRGYGEAVAGQLAAARTALQKRFAAHPYADVDFTEPALVERLQSGLTWPSAPAALTPFLEMNETQLYQRLYEAALAQVQKQTASLSLLELMEMRAAELQTQAGVAKSNASHNDLVAITLEAAYRRLSHPPIELDRRAKPQDWWLVGVPDETNPVFSFEGATLVGTGRRDQIQFLRVQVDIAPDELTALAAVSAPFEQALKQRNYYVLDELARDDRARQAFALGLAGGVIGVRQGVFALDGHATQEPVALGATVDEALEQLSQQPEWLIELEKRFNALPLATVAERLEAYLARGRNVRDEMWWEFASYVRDRLELARHQSTFVGS